MKKIAIIGASGMLGKKLFSTLQKSEDGLKKLYDVVGTTNSQVSENFIHLDSSVSENLYSFLQSQNPNIIVYSAALTDLEKCEKYPVDAYNVNTLPLEVLTQWANKNDARVVLISTDGVFDGKKGFYNETDCENPINVYGSTKFAAEQIVLRSDSSLIMRVAVLYDEDIYTKKFLGNTISKLKNNQKVKGATDLVRSPTLTDDVAYALDVLIKNEASGVYHVTGSTAVNMFEAAQTIAEVFGYDSNFVEPILSAELQSIVKRPKKCDLDCKKLSNYGIVMHSFIDGLKYVKKKL